MIFRGLSHQPKQLLFVLTKFCTLNSHSKLFRIVLIEMRNSHDRESDYILKRFDLVTHIYPAHIFLLLCSIMFSLRSISAKRSLRFQFQTTVSLFSPCLFVWARALQLYEDIITFRQKHNKIQFMHWGRFLLLAAQFLLILNIYLIRRGM